MNEAAARLLRAPGLAPVWDALPEARIVGGAVRDALLGRPVADIDLATPRLPADSMAALAAAGLRAIPTGIEHGTVTALSDHHPFEVTTLRRDVVTDGRHATVAFTDDWRADAARRDLTFNAMSLDRDGALFDYFGGAADLAAGRVRFVGDAATRIAEDFLRILRYFRFLARYGREAPDAGTLSALRDGVPGLARLSAERVWSELKRILLAPNPSDALRLMAALGVLPAVLPEATSIEPVQALVAAGAPVDPLLRLAALTRDHASAGLAERLRLSGTEASRLARLRQAAPALDDAADDAAIARALAQPGMDHDVLIHRAWLAGRAEGLRRHIARAPAPVFPLQGRDLLARGIAPGPALGEALRALHAAWLAGGCTATAEQLLRDLPDAAAN